MICEKCGTKIETNDDLFCGNCGASLPKQEISVTQNEVVSAPQKSMSPVVKSRFLIGGAVVVVLVGGYFVAKSFNGPSTPEKLQTSFQQAINNKDTKQLSQLIDPNEKDLLDPKVLSAFHDGLNEQTSSNYITMINQAIATGSSSNMSSDTPLLRIVPVKNWLGISYRVHILPAQLNIQPVSGDKVKVDLAGITADDGKINRLIPANYNYMVTYSNDFGSESVTMNTDMMQGTHSLNADHSASLYQLDPSDQIKNKLNLTVPFGLNDLSATLNGKPLTMSASNDGNTVVMPAPATGKLEVKATVMGVPIDGKVDFSTNQTNQINLSDALNQGIAKKALDILYTANVGWVKCFNDKKLEPIDGADPNGDWYKNIPNEFQSTVKESLEKVTVDPSTVQINKDSITISDEEYYKVTSNGGTSDEKADWTYTLTPANNNDWWISSTSNSWGFGSVDSSQFLTKSVDQSN